MPRELAPLGAVRIQRVPRIFFDAAEKDRRKEMLETSANYLHSLRAPVAANIVRWADGRMEYFFTIAPRAAGNSAGMVAQFNRWDVNCEEIQVKCDQFFPAGASTGAIITFTPDQPFWDRKTYSAVQQPNFFTALAQAGGPTWVQVLLQPAKPQDVQGPLQKAYKAQLGKFAGKEGKGKLVGTDKTLHDALATIHQELVTVAHQDNLFRVTYRVVVPDRAPALEREQGGAGGQDLPRGNRAREAQKDLESLARVLFLGMPGRARVATRPLELLWKALTLARVPRCGFKQVMLGKAECAWVLP